MLTGVLLYCRQTDIVELYYNDPKYFCTIMNFRLDGIVKQYFQNSFWEENKSATDALAKINFC